MRVARESGNNNLYNILKNLMPASKKKEIRGKFTRRCWISSGCQRLEDVSYVPERHILIWLLLWSRRDHRCFYGPYEGQNALEMRLGWEKLSNPGVLGSVFGLGAGTVPSCIYIYI